ncbi:protein FAM177B [Episyrphus balteatus]|uniref:protein FAM177B n=1 Tax=Episyrphus balteatus TaxID=286459 RepID=UPI0024855ED7|nr:protein FAM177B [Episyrphus balteatus]
MEADGIELNSRINNEENSRTVVNLQTPKKLLHFSDGVMEEYSDSEDECDTVMKNSEECVNVKDLQWAPYMRFKANKMGTKVLSGIDYVGGGLATFFGITASEAEIAAAKKRVPSKEYTDDEEQSSSWKSTQSRTVVSKEIKSSN